MCGIVGIVGRESANHALYNALTVLQHRGQDAAGIITEADGQLQIRKGNGLVRDVFEERHMLRLRGNVGIGHVRYPTAGSASQYEAQPFYVNSPYGVCLAHNGNLVNADELKLLVERHDRRHLNTNSDTEILLNVLAHELSRHASNGLRPDEILNAVQSLHRRCSGGYAVVAMICGHGIVAFRDPHGIRPVILGVRETPFGLERMVASESVALDVLGFEIDRDILPGEAVFIEKDGTLHSREFDGEPVYSPCIFEFVYFARPDSIIDNLSVYKARLRMGETLAAKIQQTRPHHDIDVVIPVPDTSRTSAMQVAHRLGLKYREGFIKNRYIGRTFIMPEQAARQASVRRKLNAIDLEFRGKNVLLVDDSIVRGTTSRQIVEMAREAGASKVYFASAAPPVRYPNVYGIDMPAAHELIAAGRSEEQVQRFIGADWLVYQDLEGLVAAVDHEDSDIVGFDTSCFSGEYVTGDVSSEYLHELEVVRSNTAKARRDEQVRREEVGDDTVQAAAGL
ncbi:amidophosphoribosyltransferase [Candidatus Rariloculus sp.]|uniref:amidophosphoribosyltransferase n=1 Tax=Candidatus Rariloculus sp. TaxID=3101265 RepID=UPI003D0DDED8